MDDERHGAYQRRHLRLRQPHGQKRGKPAEINPHWENKCFTAFAQPQVAADDPVLSLQGKAYLDFPVNRTELHPDYHNNPSELHKIMQTIDTVRNNANVEITSISIHGYASPEGSYQNNERLAQDAPPRSKTT